MFSSRRSGVLFHPTSLPGPQPIGSLGQAAYDFIDFLAAAGQSLWQLLPLGPTGFGNCPYSCYSAFAGNPWLIDLQQLVQDGDLDIADLPVPGAASHKVDFSAAATILPPLWETAHQNFLLRATNERRHAYEQFTADQAYWLNDYAFFQALHQQLDCDWQHWPLEVRQRQERALRDWGAKLKQQIELQKYLQFVFFGQWFQLKEYANSKGVQVFGDLPIFIAGDSVDVWANQELFHLDQTGRATLVAGVPPDYFSTTGQRWGNPLYRWDKMAQNDFSWWLARFRWNLQLFDLVRVDHFRGFAACWAIPAEEKTAINGHWLPADGDQLFLKLKAELGALPIVAEDLGIITPDVVTLRDRFGLPGMKILQFAFDSGPDNPYLPHNHIPNSVIYTGTHDNDTTLGWWKALSAKAQEQVRDYLRRDCAQMPWTLIETALMSVATLAVIPLQDILNLDGEHRMNRPGVAHGNWQWRLLPNCLDREITDKLRHLTHIYGR